MATPKATTQLRRLLRSKKFLELPAVFDPLAARIVESPGFKRTGDYTGMTVDEFITVRKQVEDLIGLEECCRIECATVEKGRKRRGRR